MICTTLNKIRDHNPCENGWRKLLKHLGKTDPDDEALPLLTILDSNELGAMLTERERWLVEKAFGAGANGYYVSAKYWLEEVVADCGVTVELVLCKDAPNAELRGAAPAQK